MQQPIVPDELLRLQEKFAADIKQSENIYHRLYWERFFTFCHNALPFLTRLFGREEMNKAIVRPYITAFPPDHWCLNRIGDKLPRWIEERYQEKDKKLVLAAAELDLAYAKIFIAEQKPPLKDMDFTKLFLQPFVEVFLFDCDLMNYRTTFLEKSIEHWEVSPFPPLDYDRPYFFVLYREERNFIFQEICRSQFLLLTRLKKGSCLEDLLEDVEGDLEKWFAQWTCLGWICKEEEMHDV